jgi:uncharacterized protein (TIGR03083 family)
MPLARPQALAMLEGSHRAVAELLASLSDDEMDRPGSIGGGDWSAKDLAVHLALWESLAIEAIEEWRRGERPGVLDLTEGRIDEVNAEEIARHRPHRPAGARARFEGVYGDLVAAIDGLTDDEWSSTVAGDGAPRTIGDVVGAALGGPSGAFDHTAAHLEDLRTYVASLRTNA